MSSFNSPPQPLKRQRFLHHLQESPCLDNIEPSCISCEHHKRNLKSGGTLPDAKELRDECRFVDFRWIKSEDGSACQLYGIEAEESGPYAYHPWFPPRNEDHKNTIKVKMALIF